MAGEKDRYVETQF